MGAQSSKTNLDKQLQEISNQINQELSDFFGTIDGFKWSGGGEVKSLEKFAKGNLDFIPTKSTMKGIKEERQVCQNLIVSYKDRLNNLLNDDKFKKKLENFIQKKGINPNKIQEVGIRVRQFSQDNDEICDDVIKYYYLKYRLFRLLKNFDPYQEEYEYVTKAFRSPKIESKFTKLSPETQKEIKERIFALETARYEYKTFALKYLKKLENDPTYKDMEDLWYELTKDNKKLTQYCNRIVNTCDNITSFVETSNPENFRLLEKSKNKQCNQINLENYKQVSVCRSGVKKEVEEKKYKERKDMDDIFDLGKFRPKKLGGDRGDLEDWFLKSGMDRKGGEMIRKRLPIRGIGRKPNPSWL